MPLLLPTLKDLVGEDSPELVVDSAGGRVEAAPASLERAAPFSVAAPMDGASVVVGLSLSLSSFSFAALLLLLLTP